MATRRGTWQKLIKNVVDELRIVAVELERRSDPEGRTSEYYATMFTRQLTDAMNAILVLNGKGLTTPAFVMLRNVFDQLLNLRYFLKIAKEDPLSAVRMLEDYHYMEYKESLEGAPVPSEIAVELAEISERVRTNYSKAERKNIRRFGFSQRSARDQATDFGYRKDYDFIYSHGSRATHGREYLYSLRVRGARRNDPLPGYIYASAFTLGTDAIEGLSQQFELCRPDLRARYADQLNGLFDPE